MPSAALLSREKSEIDKMGTQPMLSYGSFYMPEEFPIVLPANPESHSHQRGAGRSRCHLKLIMTSTVCSK